MKALAIFAACLVAASSAFAIPGPAPHPRPAPHPGPAMTGGKHGHHGHGHYWQGGGNVFFDPFAPQVIATFPAYTDVEPSVGYLPPPPVVLPFSPPPEPQRLRHTGPKIIYIGHHPTVRGPKVIYGTD